MAGRFALLSGFLVSMLMGCSAAGGEPAGKSAAAPPAGPGARTAAATVPAARPPADKAAFEPSDEITPAVPASGSTSANLSAAMAGEKADASAAGQFDAGLVRITQGGSAAMPSLASLPPEERELISSVLDAISGFRSALAEQGSLMSTKTAPIVALSDQLRAQAPLAIGTLALCRSVTQFGVYDTVEPLRFTAGKESPVIIYCELENFRSRATSDAGGARFETKLTYEAVLYTEGDTSIAVINKKPTTILDVCRNRRRDFFLADRMTLPATLPVGKYLLKVTVVDQIANRVAEKTVALMVAPN